MMDRKIGRKRRLFGWIGAVCLFLIIPIKLLRLYTSAGATPGVGVAPSIFGPLGLLFLLLSSTGRLSRLTLTQMTLLVGTITVGLEFMQLLPRPGILARVSYTFDPLDLAASLCSLVIAYCIIRIAFGGLNRR
jgi:hypothetical protein